MTNIRVLYEDGEKPLVYSHANAPEIRRYFMKLMNTNFGSTNQEPCRKILEGLYDDDVFDNIARDILDDL